MTNYFENLLLQKQAAVRELEMLKLAEASANMDYLMNPASNWGGEPLAPQAAGPLPGYMLDPETSAAAPSNMDYLNYPGSNGAGSPVSPFLRYQPDPEADRGSSNMDYLNYPGSNGAGSPVSPFLRYQPDPEADRGSSNLDYLMNPAGNWGGGGEGPLNPNAPRLTYEQEGMRLEEADELAQAQAEAQARAEYEANALANDQYQATEAQEAGIQAQASQDQRNRMLMMTGGGALAGGALGAGLGYGAGQLTGINPGILAALGGLGGAAVGGYGGYDYATGGPVSTGIEDMYNQYTMDSPAPSPQAHRGTPAEKQAALQEAFLQGYLNG